MRNMKITNKGEKMKKIIFSIFTIMTITSTMFAYQYVYPSPSENGDYYGIDNDGDGRVETEYVRSYYKSDGTYVRSHYRYSN